MSTEATGELTSRTSPSATPHESRDTQDGEGAPNAVPKLKASSPFFSSQPAPHTMQRVGEQNNTPSAHSATVLSPVGSPRGLCSATLAQESVSVVVRLKGSVPATPREKFTSTQTNNVNNANANNSNFSALNGSNAGLGASHHLNLHHNASSSPTASPRTAALLDYTVEDGTLRTPRTGRRPASRNSSLISPRPPVNTSFGNEIWAGGNTASQQTSPMVVSGDGFSGSSTPAVSVTLPKALTSPTTYGNAAANNSGVAAPSAGGGGGGGGGVGGLAAVPAAGGTTPPHLRSGSKTGGGLGSRGRVLTIRPPNSDDYRQYEFGEIFEPSVTNAALCERMLPAIMEQLQAGYNACVLCYGQTGSGKTYTMNALAPAIAGELFRSLDPNNEVIEMSYIQIYNNKAYNLLDGARGGKLGAELSKPLQAASLNFDLYPSSTSNSTSVNANAASAGAAAASSSSNSSVSGSGTCVNGAAEPKALVRSAAEVLSRMRSAARLRVTHAHALNPRSSRSFTLLTLHVTHFVDGAPLNTTRVTLADLAGTERLKKSGATGEGQSQAIFINKSLLALRELVESNNTETEVLHFRDSLLTTYLAPRMRSWHLFLLVTVSLEAGNYEETKSSLEFATNARRRRIKKLKSRTADRLQGSLAFSRLGGLGSGASNNGSGGGCGGFTSHAGSRGGGDVGELQSVIEVLHYRIHVLEASLLVAQQQRTALTQLCTPARSPGVDDALMPTENDLEKDGDARTESERLRQSEALIRQLRQDCQRYRQLLREREEELAGMPAAAFVSSENVAAAITATSLVSPTPGGPLSSETNHFNVHTAPLSHSLHRQSSFLENGSLVEVASDTASPLQPQPQHFLLSSHSSLSASVLSGDASPASATATTAAGPGGPHATSGEDRESRHTTAEPSADVAATSAPVDDAHAQLLHALPQLRLRLLAEVDTEAAVDRLYNVALRAKEHHEELRERLLVMASTVGGLRHQNHQLREEVLQQSRNAVVQDEKLQQARAQLAQEQLRVHAAACAVDALRLQLFRAYAEQPLGEELTRLYLDEQPAVEAVDALSGTQLAEHREEMEKFETHQRALQDKITELVNTVEQLTRANSQKDVSLAALESIITPAQRTLFQTMSSTPHEADGGEGDSALSVAPSEAAAAATADCFSLLQSRVSELEALLQQEQQQHRLTRCEVVEAREDARRSRQEQRQSFLQQQEEERRVAQLTAENFDLRQQNERHQMYLDQIHVHFQEQLLELRRYHVAEMAEQRRTFEEAQEQQRQPRAGQSFPPPTPHREDDGQGDAVDAAVRDDVDLRGFCQTSTRRGTSHGPLPSSHDWTGEDTARGVAEPPSQRTYATAAPAVGGDVDGDDARATGEAFQRDNSATLPQLQLSSSTKAKRDPHTLTLVAAPAKESKRRVASSKRKGHGKKSKGKTSAGGALRAKRGSSSSGAAAAPASSRGRTLREKSQRPSLNLNSTQPPMVRLA